MQAGKRVSRELFRPVSNDGLQVQATHPVKSEAWHLGKERQQEATTQPNETQLAAEPAKTQQNLDLRTSGASSESSTRSGED
jgi:hypothetical protein